MSDDLFFRALNRALDEVRIVRVKCGWCEGLGKVAVPNPDLPWASLATCSQCRGKGFINVESNR